MTQQQEHALSHRYLHHYLRYVLYLAQPGHAVERIEDGARKGKGIEDFCACGKSFKIDGAEGDRRFAQSLGDGRKCAAGAAEDCDAVFLIFVAARSRLTALFDSV